MDRDYFVTPSGSTVTVQFDGTDKWPHRDAERNWFRVQDSAGAQERLNVALVSPILINAALQQKGYPQLTPELKTHLTYLAAVTHFDRIDTVPQDENNNRVLEIEGPEALSLLERPRAPDRDLRRYVARRVYQAYTHETLNALVMLDEFDFLLMGAGRKDFLRSCEVLAEEGYLRLEAGPALVMRATAKLVRDVERFGAAREDVVAERDYMQAVRSYPALQEFVPDIELEYRRYSAAMTDTELESVFKAASPVVEAIAKRLLAAHGSSQHHPSLGPVIADLQSRGLAGPALLSQLNHILKFARDLSQHGTSLPQPVLRIACENAFELVPQLGALWPR